MKMNFIFIIRRGAGIAMNAKIAKRSPKVEAISKPSQFWILWQFSAILAID